MSEPETNAEKVSPDYRPLISSSISHGAFRTMHMLLDRNNSKGKTWPGRRFIQKALHCSTGSIKKWIEELEAAGWLSVERKVSAKGYRKYVYTTLNGKGGLFLKSATYDVAKSSNEKGRCQNRKRHVAKSSNDSVSSNSNRSNTPKGSTKSNSLPTQASVGGRSARSSLTQGGAMVARLRARKEAERLRNEQAQS